MEIIIAGFLAFLRLFSALIVFHMLRTTAGTWIVATFSAAVTLSMPLGAVSLSSTAALDTFTLVLFAFRELLLGCAIGLPAAFACEALIIAGKLADLARGSQISEQYYPALGSQTSLLEQAAIYGVLALLLSSSAVLLLIEAIVNSFHATPAGMEFALEAPVGKIGPWLATLLSGVGEQLKLGILFAAPLLCFGLVLDLLTGLLSRVLARMNVSVEVAPLKLTLGLLIFALSLPYLFERSAEGIESAIVAKQTLTS